MSEAGQCLSESADWLVSERMCAALQGAAKIVCFAENQSNQEINCRVSGHEVIAFDQHVEYALECLL